VLIHAGVAINTHRGSRGKLFPSGTKFTRVFNGFGQLLKLARVTHITRVFFARGVLPGCARLAHGGGQRVLFLVLAICAIDTRRGCRSKLFPNGTKFTLVFSGFGQFLKLARVTGTTQGARGTCNKLTG
jgi:hypothetical protein